MTRSRIRNHSPAGRQATPEAHWLMALSSPCAILLFNPLDQAPIAVPPSMRGPNALCKKFWGWSGTLHFHYIKTLTSWRIPSIASLDTRYSRTSIIRILPTQLRIRLCNRNIIQQLRSAWPPTLPSTPALLPLILFQPWHHKSLDNI